MKQETEKPSFFVKLATVIVDKRNLIFFLYACALIFCLFSRNWVGVCNDITQYLPETTETRQGLTLMEQEFTTYATARVMVSHVTYLPCAGGRPGPVPAGPRRSGGGREYGPPPHGGGLGGVFPGLHPGQLVPGKDRFSGGGY